MKIFLQTACTLLMLLMAGTVHAQYCTDGDRFTQKEIFSAEQIMEVKDIQYGQVINCQDQAEVLRLDLYAPSKNADDLEKRPLILLMHGGSFISGNKTNLTNDCIAFARRGYVAVTIGYRLGWDVGSYTCASSANTQVHAAYRAMQDLHSALRFLVAHAEDYGIDTQWVFIGGNSAGAVASLNLAFATQEEMDVRVPFLKSDLGPLNNSGNTLTHGFGIKGVFNNWGALLDPDLIQPADRIPVIAFHGDQDATVPIDAGSNGGNRLFGSRVIHHRLDSLGICSDLTVKIGGGHGIYNSSRAQNDFRVNRAACFFKQIFCEHCTTFYSTDSIAPDCSNIATGFPGKTLKEGILIHPNPVNDLFQISGIASTSPWTLELLNIQGQVLLYDQNVRQLDIKTLSAGIYFLRFRQAGSSQVFKLVKE